MFFRKLASLQNFGLLLVYPSNAGRQFVELCRGDFRESGGNTVNRKCSPAICVTQVEAENICAVQLMEPQPSQTGRQSSKFSVARGDKDRHFLNAMLVLCGRIFKEVEIWTFFLGNKLLMCRPREMLGEAGIFAWVVWEPHEWMLIETLTPCPWDSRSENLPQ